MRFSVPLQSGTRALEYVNIQYLRVSFDVYCGFRISYNAETPVITPSLNEVAVYGLDKVLNKEGSRG